MILRTFSLLRCQTSVCLRWVPGRTIHSAAIEDSGKSGVILQSLSTDIYENLALEDWIHDNVSFENRSILFMWRNSPAVVIGRHQNPWQECKLPLLRQKGIPLARRRSGGGTVFHDLGNINLTFFTCKKKYDRRRNLRVVTDALKGLRPYLDVQATERFDILLNGHYKISGTAAKVGRVSAYHHCTLLCCADRALLSALLAPTCPGICSSATPSVPSPVQNLLDQDPSLDFEAILSALAAQYNTEFGLGGPVLHVDPSDELQFPGIRRMGAALQAWDWVFGRTPKFSVCTPVPLGGGLSADVHIQIKGGLIDSCTLELPSDWLPQGACEELCSLLIGARFCPSGVAAPLAALLRSASHAGMDRRLSRLAHSVTSLMG